MTVYIDSLFLTNFFMDSVILFITSIIRREQITALRLLCGAGVCAIYGTLIFFPYLSFIYSAFLKIIFSAIPVIICFKDKNFKGFLSSLLCFWFITAAAGGTVFILSTATSFGNVMQTMVSNCVIYVSLSPFILLSGCVILYFLTEVYRRSCIKNFTADRLIINLRIDYMGNVYTMKGLVDTGCELTEPLSGAPVIVAEREMFKDVYTSGAFLSINTASGAGRLELIFADKIYSDSPDYQITYDAVIALSDNKVSEDNLYNALINPNALFSEEILNNKSVAGCLK